MAPPSGSAGKDAYAKLQPLQQLEIFEMIMSKTSGMDLARVMHEHSQSNWQEWLARRSTYTRSLAVMSMVGYLLGLGDRHPSNLMIHRTSGKVVHIDFGDWCVDNVTIESQLLRTCRHSGFFGSIFPVDYKKILTCACGLFYGL